MNGDRIYSALLALYPKAFRGRYRDEMAQAYRDLRRNHRRSTAAFWIFIVSDLVRSLLREHVDGCRTGTRRFVLVWLAFCALGIVVTGVLASALVWIVGYLYHPYLEELTLPPWTYGAFLGLGLGALQAAILRRYLRVSVEWIRCLLAGAVAAALGLLSLAISIGQTSGGLNPLPSDTPFFYELVVECLIAMAVSGIVVGVSTVWPVRSLVSPERTSC
jgi:hypothetical protein